MQIYWGAWGGSWGMSWLGSWGASWGEDAVEEHPDRYGGGTHRRPVVDDAQLHRDHWEYMDRLRERQARATSDQEPAAAAVPARQAIKPAKAPLVARDARAMRGTVEPHEKPPDLAGILGNPLMLAALAVAIDEADD